MATSTYETVYTITNWYDGARTGIANVKEEPHYYQCEVDYGPDEDYLLSPLDDEAFQLALEDWEIWLRWQTAFDKGLTSQATHPALLEDEVRHKELTNLLSSKLVINHDVAIKAKAHFSYGKSTVVQ